MSRAFLSRAFLGRAFLKSLFKSSFGVLSKSAQSLVNSSFAALIKSLLFVGRGTSCPFCKNEKGIITKFALKIQSKATK